MADVAQLAVSPEQRRSKLTPLMKAKTEAITGQKVNFCPYGCEDGDLDEHGYCRHLVGFTNDGKLFEPMYRTEGGRRVVRCEMQPKHPGDRGPDVEMVPVLKPVLKTDKLVQITVSYRVYRNVDAVAEESPENETKRKK